VFANDSQAALIASAIESHSRVDILGALHIAIVIEGHQELVALPVPV